MAIDILLPELLLEIFMMNADMDGDYSVTSDFRALLITMKSSHVCRMWREVILNSSHLWGRIIDLDRLLTSKSDNWMGLVMHRTGKSDLWIQSCTYRNSYALGVFLAKYWDRIRSFKVSVQASDQLVEFWTTLKRPAPRLEVFNLRFEMQLNSGTVQSSPCENIFSNHAPRLHIFLGDGISCKPHPGWTSQIRNISLKSTRFTVSTSFTVRRLLDLLSQTPLLESLNLCCAWNCEPKEYDIPTHTISLPNLQNIEITDNFDMSAGILSHLVIPMTCRIRLQVDLRSIRLDEDVVGLETLFKSGPLSYTPMKVLKFQVKDCHFLIRDLNDTLMLLISGKSTKVAFNQIIVPCALRLLHLPSITELELDFSLDDNISYSILRQSFLSLSNVKILKMTLPMLEEILSLPKSIPPAMPSLQELSITGMVCYSTNLTSLIPDFVAWRKEIGFPIEHLDLTSSIFKNVNAKCLETMTGLKVSWRRKKDSRVRNYVCGSGDPKTLFK